MKRITKIKANEPALEKPKKKVAAYCRVSTASDEQLISLASDIDLSQKIYNHAIQCRFDNCGILPIDEIDGFRNLYQKRVDSVPSARYFYEGVGNLRGTKERFPWARSIVVLTFDFGKFRYPKELQGKYAKAFFLEPDGNNRQSYDLKRFETWFADHKIHMEGGRQFGNVSVGSLRYIAEKAGLEYPKINGIY